MQTLSGNIHYKNLKLYIKPLFPDEVIEYNTVIQTLEENYKTLPVTLQLRNDSVYKHLRQNLVSRGLIVSKINDNIKIELIN